MIMTRKIMEMKKIIEPFPASSRLSCFATAPLRSDTGQDWAHSFHDGRSLAPHRLMSLGTSRIVDNSLLSS